LHTFACPGALLQLSDQIRQFLVVELPASARKLERYLLVS
jgi:hypothetical protein